MTLLDSCIGSHGAKFWVIHAVQQTFLVHPISHRATCAFTTITSCRALLVHSLPSQAAGLYLCIHCHHRLQGFTCAFTTITSCRALLVHSLPSQAAGLYLCIHYHHRLQGFTCAFTTITGCRALLVHSLPSQGCREHVTKHYHKLPHLERRCDGRHGRLHPEGNPRLLPPGPGECPQDTDTVCNSMETSGCGKAGICIATDQYVLPSVHTGTFN